MGRLTLRAAHPLGHVILRVRKPNATTHVIWLNGRESPALAGGAETPTRDALRLWLESLAQPLPLNIQPLGVDALHLAPLPGDTMLSVLTSIPGEYRVRIEGRWVRIVVGPGQSLRGVRDQLMAAISRAFPRAVNPFLDNGIRLRQPAPLVEVDPWEGRIGIGPDLRIGNPRTSGNLEILPGDRFRVETADPRLGVIGAEPEVPGQAFAQLTLAAVQGGPTATSIVPSTGPRPDFYVMALPFEEASRLIWEAEAAKPPGESLDGCFAQLLEFEKRTGRRGANGDVKPLRRDGYGRPYPPEYPLRDLSGIQYYFENHVRIAPGHAYFEGAPWGLSSISQLAYWRERMSAKSAFLGQLSVDVGDWYAPRREEPLDDTTAPVHPSAWRSSRQAIAGEVWEQVKAGVREDKAARIVPPTYYHLDRGIRFADASGGRTFARRAHLRYGAGAATLLVEDIPIAPNPWAPDPLKTAIEASTPHLAFATANEIVIAPAARGQKTVRIFVHEAKPGLYRVSVDKRQASFLAPQNATAEQVVNGLKTAIDQNVGGVIATRQASTGALLLELADENSAVSAIDPDQLASPALFAVDPCGSVHVRAMGAVTIEDLHEATPSRNATPFLINGPGVWRYRPGLRDRSEFADWTGMTDTLPFEDGAPDIAYQLTKQRWVMAGNHMATYTRISTMESANESARHAVIAMLRAVSEDDGTLYTGGGQLLGELPRIWDPEEHELDDLLPLRRLDDELHKRGLPHFFDILRIPELVDGMLDEVVRTRFGDLDVSLEKQLRDLVSSAITTFEKDWGFSNVDEITKAMRAAVEALIRP
jgi:hypothetical protein